MTNDSWVQAALPPAWTVTPLGTLCDVVRGASPRPMGNPRFFGGDIPFIKIADVTSSDGMTVREAETTVTREGAERSRMIESGRLILTNSATVCVPVFLGVDACIHDGFVAFENLADCIDQKYMYYFFKYVRPFVLNQHKQGVTQVNLNTGIVSEMSFILPPTREQQRIVAKIEELFSELDNGIEALATARQQVAAYRQAALKAAFAGQLAGAEIRSWTEYSVGQLVTDARYGTAKKCTVDPTKTPVLRIPNIASSRIDLSDLKHADFDEDEMEKLRLEAGDILIVRSNGSASLVGLSAIVTDDAVGYAYAGYLIRLRLNRDIILPQFLNLYLHSPWVRAGIERQARSSSGVHNVNSEEIRAIVVRVPSIQEQMRIVSAVSELLSRIEDMQVCLETEVQRGNALRQAVLQKAFSGKLVAQDPRDEPASVLLERIRAERGDEAPRKRRNNKNGRKEAA